MQVGTSALIAELHGIEFGDDRLNQRLEKMMSSFASNPSLPIARSFISGAEAKAAYRFFENDKVRPELIKEKHREQTLNRMSQYSEVLVLQDTTFLDYSKHINKEGLGSIGRRSTEKAATKGLIAHHALAVTLEGIPLGLVDQAIWARSPENEVESRKWLNSFSKSIEQGIKTKTITVADREADFDELIEAFHSNGEHFVIRAKKTRASVEKRGRKIIDDVRDSEIMASYNLQLTDRLGVIGKLEGRAKRKSGERREALLEVRALKVSLQNIKEPVNAVLVTEKNPPEKGNEICWFLLTDLSIESAQECLRVVDIYTKRWLIEIFFKTLKTGCGIEECRLQNAQKVEIYVALMSIIGWWLLYLQQISRAPGTQIDLKEIFDETEIRILRAHGLKDDSSLETAVEVLCRLAGYKKFKKTDRPGIYSIWLGWLALQNAIRVLRPLVSTQYVGSR